MSFKSNQTNPLMRRMTSVKHILLFPLRHPPPSGGRTCCFPVLQLQDHQKNPRNQSSSSRVGPVTSAGAVPRQIGS